MKEVAVPVHNIGERRAATAQLFGFHQVAGHHLGANAQFLVERVIIAVGNLQGQLLAGNGVVAHHRSGHEDVHHFHQITVAVDFHRVLVIFKAAPNLAQLASGDFHLAAGAVAHHHDVGGFGKAV